MPKRKTAEKAKPGPTAVNPRYQRAPMSVAGRQTVRLKRSSYQPGKAELEADVGIDETPERLAEAALGIVTIQPDDDKGA